MRRDQLAHLLRAAAQIADDPEILVIAEPARAICLEPHDLVASTLVVQREKDCGFAHTLIAAGLIDVTTLRRRLTELPDEEGVDRANALAWLDATSRALGPEST